MVVLACRCGGLIKDRVCSRCGPKRQERNVTTTERGYGGDWQRVRARCLRHNPLCHDCSESGRVTIAKEVHHVKKIKDRPDLRLDERNLMTLCKRCHEVRSARGE